ncbi:MAG: rod shape-determining protein RodA [Actinobacteria bacterium]|nr:rod shape-determining protein RodA [Actinomycetota bacterium]MBW3649259.1 rod shape-determining protein RodA [Actinomycetota bacterium]
MSAGPTITSPASRSASGGAPGAGASRSPLRRTDGAAPWRHVDLTLVGAVLALSSFGLLMVYSATRSRLAEAGLDPQYYLQRQALFVAIGVGVMIVTTVIDYRVYRDFAPMIYALTVGLLVMVLLFGAINRGQQASFNLGAFQVQPSEFAKISLIVCLAAYVWAVRAEVDGRRLLVILATAGVPMALIYLQPDLGTTLVFGAILMGMLLVSGARPRHLVALLLLGVAAVVVVIQLGVLKQYQIDRLTSFLDPKNDTQRSAYNLDQSKTAIGSGGILGKGLFRGSQTNLSYVPEQHTDFIFTAVGEQLGLLGSGLLLVLFALVVWRTWRAAVLAKDHSGTMMCVGVLAMLTFQIFENVGMTMGIMPITGIPLPLLSYGGSSTLATFAGIGLVLNVHMRRFT